MDVKDAVNRVSEKENGVILIATHQTTANKATEKVKLEFIQQHLYEEKDMIGMTREELIGIIADFSGHGKIVVKKYLTEHGIFKNLK